MCQLEGKYNPTMADDISKSHGMLKTTSSSILYTSVHIFWSMYRIILLWDLEMFNYLSPTKDAIIVCSNAPMVA